VKSRVNRPAFVFYGLSCFSIHCAPADKVIARRAVNQYKITARLAHYAANLSSAYPWRDPAHHISLET